MWRQLKIAILFLVVITVIVGVIYPLIVTGVAQAFFHKQANGSLIVDNGKVTGSSLIGQQFSDPKYFWGRLSATSPVPYNAASSSGSNLGPENPALQTEVQARIDALKAASGSGLDPDISIAAADYQINRVALNRNFTVEQVSALVKRFTTGRTLGILGEPRVNVLKLNLALDNLK
jgi:K+-transporting ATPase KdpC subunit